MNPARTAIVAREHPAREIEFTYVSFGRFVDRNDIFHKYRVYHRNVVSPNGGQFR
jgi:hypothetical protein